MRWEWKLCFRVARKSWGRTKRFCERRACGIPKLLISATTCPICRSWSAWVWRLRWRTPVMKCAVLPITSPGAVDDVSEYYRPSKAFLSRRVNGELWRIKHVLKYSDVAIPESCRSFRVLCTRDD